MVQVVTTEAEGCEECLKTGDGWVHLRLCMICGKVGCCDDSPNTHATNHFQAEGHALMRSIEPEDSWAYCFVRAVMLPDPAAGAAAWSLGLFFTRAGWRPMGAPGGLFRFPNGAR